MKQVQRQEMQQKFSPQQIQLMRLLQMPVTDLELAIKEEVEKNPLLEAETVGEEPLPETAVPNEQEWEESDDTSDYDIRERSESDPNAERHEFVVSDNASFAERMLAQASLLGLDERQMQIAAELIGSLDDAGYLSRPLDLIANDLAFSRGIEATESEVEAVLHSVQELDPPGVGARSLQECLLIQLRRMADDTAATEIIEHHFDDFANHRYDRICANLNLDREELDRAEDVIRRLNPKPGGSSADDVDQSAYITPDIVLSQHDSQLQFYLNDGSLPRLSLNSYYTDMLHQLEQQKDADRETLQFLRTKQNDAQQFIDILAQRHETIVRIMRYITAHQKRFLLSGNPDDMLPLRQREVAEATGLDISTVSRMANSKYLQTDFGTIPLKDCFSKGFITADGDEVAVDNIKQRIADIIAAEDKKKPLSDDALTRMLNEQGMPLARRTVAKYREQLGLPVARLRRMMIATLLLLSCTFTKATAQMSYYDSIIAARIEASAKAENKVKNAAQSKVERQVKTKATEKNTTKGRKASAATASTEEASASESSTMPAYMAPMWYDHFPSHRVNPMGRTMVDQMPDEVHLRLIRDSVDFCFPVKGVKTSPYGWRWQRGHHGVDIKLQTGDPVHAAFSGVVRVSSRMGGYGNCIVLRHPNGLETLYGHLSKINVKPGQQVAAGDVIGLGGSTGNSTGPHLHFECRFLYQTFDPEWILDFSNYSLRTKSLHLDKSYFGIRQPRKGESVEYKADSGIVKESTKKRKSKAREYTDKDF